jgi:hypothetical protein
MSGLWRLYRSLYAGEIRVRYRVLAADIIFSRSVLGR